MCDTLKHGRVLCLRSKSYCSVSFRLQSHLHFLLIHGFDHLVAFFTWIILVVESSAFWDFFPSSLCALCHCSNYWKSYLFMYFKYFHIPSLPATMSAERTVFWKRIHGFQASSSGSCSGGFMLLWSHSHSESCEIQII